jgi:hypothetical protein
VSLEPTKECLKLPKKITGFLQSTNHLEVIETKKEKWEE